MKNIYFLIIASFLFATSCTEPDNHLPIVGEGGLLEVTTPSLNYVVGDNKPYTVEFMVMQGSVKTEKVEVYSSFHTTQEIDGSSVAVTSNEVMLKELSVDNEINHFKSFSVEYSELIANLQINSTALPTSDSELAIGDKWILRLVSTLSDGRQVENNVSIDLTVSTRFAGTYKVIDLAYYRIGVESPSYWLGDQVVIRSIDAKTYMYDWGATVGWTGPLYFQIDDAGNIVYPDEWDGAAQVLNDQPLTTPTSSPTNLTNVIPLAPSGQINKAIRDDVEGKDQLIMVYGYLTAGSGPREFYEVLEKVVN